jgi:flagellar basal body-associated protein FliL
VKKKKLLIIVGVVLLVVVGGYYKFVMSAKGGTKVKDKVTGTLVTLPTDFVVNLAGGHYGKVTVALLETKPPPVAADGTAPVPKENAAVRAVVTDELTGLQPDDLISRAKRHTVVKDLLAALKERTDEPVTDVLLTDIAVQ